jgi:hypothetical protein
VYITAVWKLSAKERAIGIFPHLGRMGGGGYEVHICQLTVRLLNGLPKICRIKCCFRLLYVKLKCRQSGMSIYS